MAVLMESWLSAEGDWTKSEFYVCLKTRHTSKKTGARRWMMESEIAAKYRAAGHSNPEKIAADIVALKETDVHLAKSHIKPNPDLPEEKALRLFLVFDGAAEVDSEDTVFDSMFSASSNHDMMTAGDHQVDRKPKKDKGKKRRRSSSSDESSDTDTSGDISSTDSSSSNKKNKKKKKGEERKEKQERKQEKQEKQQGWAEAGPYS